MPGSRKMRDQIDAAVNKIVAVTQATSNSTAVTCNGYIGTITMEAVLAAGAGVDFTVNNSVVTTASRIELDVVATTATAAATRVNLNVGVASVAAGSFVVHVQNGDAAATSAAPVIHFSVFYPRQ